MNKSASCPAIHPAKALRQYSQDRKRITGERVDRLPQITYEQVDLIGGNGRWRQRKAQEEWERHEVEEAERRRQQLILEQERKRRLAFVEEKRRKHAEEERLRFMQEKERRLREQREREEAQRREEELERMKREREHQEWLALQPTDCEKCKGTGVCPACLGKAFSYEVFLVPTVTKDTTMDFGRLMQGCAECGGCRQNMLGTLIKGSGRCAACGGSGKIWPAAAYNEALKVKHRFTVASTTLSPKVVAGAHGKRMTLQGAQAGPLPGVPQPPSPTGQRL
jgi:hypothetical protein